MEKLNRRESVLRHAWDGEKTECYAAAAMTRAKTITSDQVTSL